jgi:tRNA-binding protein
VDSSGTAPSQITWDDFVKVDLRAGTVVRAEEFPEARKPAYRIWVDFGELGVKQTSAQVTRFYRPSELVGRRATVDLFPLRSLIGIYAQLGESELARRQEERLRLIEREL